MKHRINILIYVVLMILSIVFIHDSELLTPLLILWTVLFISILSLGVLFLRFNYFFPSITHFTTQECLLTFDDGPHPEHTPYILDVLKKRNIKALFFIIGEKAEKHPEIVERIIQEGHLVGNHSYSHNKFMAMFPTTTLIEDLEKCQVVLKKITGKETPFFRPPIGYSNPNFARALKVLKLKSVGWSLRSYDTIYSEEKKLLSRLIQKTKKSDIILLHDNLPQTVSILAEYIETASTNGILFASGDLKNKLKYD